MMLDEFCKLLGKECKLIDWDAIERVYMWHPSFDRTDAKKVAVELYRLLGVTPFLAMFDDATRAMTIEEEITAAKRTVAELEIKRDSFRALFR